MFRMYKRLHKDWGSCNNHIMRILKRGGTIAKAFDHNGGVMLIYDYMTFDEAQDELDKIFNELRDKYGMDDSRNGDLTKVYGKGWVIADISKVLHPNFEQHEQLKSNFHLAF